MNLSALELIGATVVSYDDDGAEVRQFQSRAKLLTRESLAATTAARWKAQYNFAQSFSDESWSRKVYDQLIALGPAPNPDAVDAVIGNPSWTHPHLCNLCGKGSDEALELGAPEDSPAGDSPITVCTSCTERLAKAVLGQA